ncbi:MAG: HAD-IIIC family phosphatase [Lachnospiraceae bacterium]|nr:HAD-IIIC family phosphatase [Lachnospiraceae bacterium]
MIAILSNINIDYVLRLVSKEYEAVPAEGYGDIWGKMLDSNSAYCKCDPDITFLIMDIEQLLNEQATIDGGAENGRLADGKQTSGQSVSEQLIKKPLIKEQSEEAAAYSLIDSWFDMLQTLISPLKTYFVSDVTFRSPVLADNDSFFMEKTERYWMERLDGVMREHRNVHALKLSPLIQQYGKRNFFSEKLWYMGKIPYSNEGTKLFAGEICRLLSLINRTPKKVLVLDLDNTLWGGVLGECGAEGIELSDDHLGAVYKQVQRKLLRMKRSGVLLAVCSKNNLSDVEEVWEKNPHMLLARSDFAAVRINWTDKADNLVSMAHELNLGLDSFVFIDDMPAERENILARLHSVVVPGFPEKIEDYPAFMDKIYAQYFQTLRMTGEDREKTRQYMENVRREEASRGLTYEEFLRSLHLEAERVGLDEARLDRVAQLFAKTNQFNLTTHRYSGTDLEKMLRSHYDIYAYQVRDKFGDYGLVAVAVVNTEVPEIDSFLMSCRVMGKQVESFVINEIEEDLLRRGFTFLRAGYIKTKKNAPVAELYESLGYQTVSATENVKNYCIDLTKRPERRHFVNQSKQL